MHFETIGDRIKYLRKEKGLSQEELASLLNTTKQAVYKYESNLVTNIPMDKIETLSKIFNVSPSYIMGWCGGIGDRIKLLRLDWGFTTHQLAKYLNKSEETIKSWEYGRSTPSLDDICDISKVFDVTKEQLIADDQEILHSLRHSESEDKLLRLFRQIPAEKQEMVLEMIRVALGNQVQPK